MTNTIDPAHVDQDALIWFGKHLAIQDQITQIMKQARIELDLPLVPSNLLTKEQVHQFTTRVRALIDGAEDRDLINAHLVADSVVSGVVRAADQHEAEVAAGVPNLADRR